MVNTIEKTSYPAYANLRIGYHLVITQTGTELTGDGEKITENGRSMADYERTPIHLTGSVDQNSVSATFVEEGQRRGTNGRLEWTLASGGNQLRGTFSSTAAKSSGSSVARVRGSVPLWNAVASPARHRFGCPTNFSLSLLYMH